MHQYIPRELREAFVLVCEDILYKQIGNIIRSTGIDWKTTVTLKMSVITYSILGVLVILKIVFWVCYCCLRTAECFATDRPRNFTVETISDSRSHNDRSPIVDYEVLPDTRTCPPGTFYPQGYVPQHSDRSVNAPV